MLPLANIIKIRVYFDKLCKFSHLNVLKRGSRSSNFYSLNFLQKERKERNWKILMHLQKGTKITAASNPLPQTDLILSFRVRLLSTFVAC